MPPERGALIAIVVMDVSPRVSFIIARIASIKTPAAAQQIR